MDNITMFVFILTILQSALTRPLRRVNLTNSGSVSSYKGADYQSMSRVDVGYGQEPRLTRSDSVGSNRLLARNL